MNDIILQALDRARRMSDLGAHDAAIEAWRDVLTEDPLLPEAHAGLANSLFQHRRLVAARVEANRALELDGECFEALIVLALCDFFENRRKRAFARLDEVLAINPLDVEAHHIKAQFLRDAGRWTEAEAAILKARELSPNDVAVRLEEGRLAQVRGQSDRAEAIARELLADDPENVGALALLGTVLRNNGQIDEAHHLALSALSIDPIDADALDLIAAIKLSRNLIGGVFWHIIRWLREMGERKLQWFAWFLYVGYLLILTTMSLAGLPTWMDWAFIALYLAFCIGVWTNRMLIDTMVAKELKTFRWSAEY